MIALDTKVLVRFLVDDDKVQSAKGGPTGLVRALAAFIRGKGDFADSVIKEHAQAAGCDGVATFDRTLLKEEGFVAP